LLRLAEHYGWCPAGTRANEAMIRSFFEESQLEGEALDAAVAREVQDWPGDYTTNDGQIVDRADAEAMACALTRALPDVPVMQTDPTRTEVDLGKGLRFPVPDLRVFSNALAVFSGSGRTYLEEFIDFCRGGEFVIA
jgi:hypothetical protein